MLSSKLRSISFTNSLRSSSEELRYANFLKGSSTFYLSHQEDGYVVSNGEFDYPILSESDY